MKIKICQISVRDLIEWLSTGWTDWDRLGRLSGIWLDMATRSQNQGMLGHPKACWATPEQSE